MFCFKSSIFALVLARGLCLARAPGTWDQGCNSNGIPNECDIDQADLDILIADWGCTGGNSEGGCDGDGDTDQADLGTLLAQRGAGCE